MQPTHELLAGFPAAITIPILFADLDAFNHVNNLAYLRWCETGRVDYMIRAGLWLSLPPTGLGPIVASVHCDYKRPLNYPGTVEVGTRVSRIGNSSLQMEQSVVSRELNAVAAEVTSIMVVLDYGTGRTARVPDPIRQAIAQLEGKAF